MGQRATGVAGRGVGVAGGAPGVGVATPGAGAGRQAASKKRRVRVVISGPQPARDFSFNLQDSQRNVTVQLLSEPYGNAKKITAQSTNSHQSK